MEWLPDVLLKFKCGFRVTLVDSVGMEEQERERRRQVVEKFQKAPFEDIAAHCVARVRRKHLTFIHIVVFLVSP